MLASFEIRSSTGSYDVVLGEGLLADLVREPGERVYVADAFFAETLTAAGIDAITLVADEQAKSLEQMGGLIEAMKQRRVTRNTTLVAVGGGVIQDAAAFVASVYMRGISWIYVPTTLLSMTDSCIGGKSSINVGAIKNIVGTFHPPLRVVIDPAMVQTLTVEQKVAGLCEAAKICACGGVDTFRRYQALECTGRSGTDTVRDVIALSLATKKWFIEVDEFDKKERLTLNFGHTFGHAIESASKFAVSHGVAVGLGILAAARFVEIMGQDARAPAARGHALIGHLGALLGDVDGLDRALAGVTVDALMTAFEADKKHGRDTFAVIVMDETGTVERRVVRRSADVIDAIRQSFAKVLEEFRVDQATAAA